MRVNGLIKPVEQIIQTITSIQRLANMISRQIIDGIIIGRSLGH